MASRTDALKQSFTAFCILLWIHLGLKGLTRIQKDIAAFLQDGPRRRMVKAFRGVGKSWLTAAYVLWRLFRNPEERILVVSASKERADAFSVFVRRLIEEVPWLRHLKPRPGQRDSVVSFDVGPASAHQAPSVKSVGITGQLAGSRATIIVADDVETPSNSLTQLMRDRLSEMVKEFDAVLVPDGEIIYLGTDQTEESLYKRLPERGYTVRVWPARFPKAAKVADYGDSLAPVIHELRESSSEWAPTDPERFDNEDLLEREASYGRAGFALQFMLDPSLSDQERYPLKIRDLIVTALTPEEGPLRLAWGAGRDNIIEDLQAVGLVGDRWHAPLKRSTIEWAPYTAGVMYVDPSGRGSDETGYAVVKHLHGKLYLTRAGGLSGGYDETTLETICRIAKEQQLRLVQVEPNFGDGMFRQLLQPVMQRIHPGCAVEDAEWSKGQKEVRIIDTLEPVLMQHKLIVCRSVIEADLNAKRDNQLFYQLTRLTRERGSLRHDDRVEALAGAVHFWLDTMSRDEEQAYRDHKQEALDAELAKFMEEATGRKPKGPLWAIARGRQ